MPRLIGQATGPDQSKTGRETPRKAERQEKDKDDARPKTTTTTAPAATAERQTKQATKPQASNAPQKADEKEPTREKDRGAFSLVDSTSDPSARRKAEGKKKVEETPAAAAQRLPQQPEKPAVASTGTGKADQQEMDAAEGGDAKKAAKGKEKEEDREAVGTRRKPTGEGSFEGGKPTVGEEKQGGGIGGLVSGWGQRKQLVVNVVVASLVVVGLGFYITSKLRSHGNKE